MTLALALLAAGYGVMFTVLDDFRDRYGISESSLGLIVATGFFLSFVGQITLAPLADRGHARSLMIGGLLIDVVGLVGMAYGTTLPALLGARVLMGLGTGMAYPAIKRVVILADPEHLGQNLGVLLSADVAGFATGPVISALTVGPFGLKAPFLVLAVLTTSVIPFVSRATFTEAASDASPERFAVDLIRLRPLAGAIVIGMAVFLMIGTFDALWAVMMDDLKAPVWMANVGITVFALPLIVLGPIGGRIAQRHGPFRISSLGLTIGACFIFAYGQLPQAWMLLAIGMFHALNDGLTITGTGIAVGLVAPPERLAAAQGLLGGVQTLTGGLAAMAAGWSYDHFGRSATFATSAALMVTLVAIGSRLTGPAWHGRPHAEAVSLAA